MSDIMAWLCLVIASTAEVAWVYSLKYLSKDKLVAIQWGHFFQSTAPILAILPLVGYIVFGVTNIWFLSLAMKTIPTSIAFAVWTGMAIIGTKLVDSLVLGESISPMQLFFFGCILAGVIGLKFQST